MPIIAKADKLPPFLVRILSRKKHGHAPLSHSDIAERSGIPRSTVAMLSRLTTWSKVSFDVADRFAKACGVDLAHPGKHLKDLRRAKWAHVKNANANQRRFLAGLMNPKAAT